MSSKEEVEPNFAIYNFIVSLPLLMVTDFFGPCLELPISHRICLEGVLLMDEEEEQ